MENFIVLWNLEYNTNNSTESLRTNSHASSDICVYIYMIINDTALKKFAIEFWNALSKTLTLCERYIQNL